MKKLLFAFLIFLEAVFVQGEEVINESPEQCVLPKNTGPCRAALRRYYFNAVTETCDLFLYGGCGTLGNNMLTQEDCERICTTAMKQKSIEANGLNLACSFPKTNGVQCPDEDIAEENLKWYYDQESAACKSFTYTGCGGNQNQFSSEKDCNDVCITRDQRQSSLNEQLVGPEEEQPRKTSGGKVKSGGEKKGIGGSEESHIKGGKKNNKTKRQSKKAKKLAKKKRAIEEKETIPHEYGQKKKDKSTKRLKRQNKPARKLAKKSSLSKGNKRNKYRY